MSDYRTLQYVIGLLCAQGTHIKQVDLDHEYTETLNGANVVERKHTGKTILVITLEKDND